MINNLTWTFICFGIGIFFGLMELFVPSGGVLSFLTLAAVIASLVFAFLHDTFFGAVYVFSLVLVLPCLFWLAVKAWPHTLIGRRVLLNPEDDPALRPNADLLAIKQMVGKQGITRSRMVFSGQIEIDGQRYSAVSDMEMLDAGVQIEVVGLDGMTMLVRRKEDNTNNKKTDPTNQTPNKISEPITIEDPFV
ncbi:MAG: NfeD family protein [Planctomycetaceae bacterium]|jgi:membrane-bound serine protease (ClpP class)|nr:NfeD family protein [Planctomycetaceae bacterium]